MTAQPRQSRPSSLSSLAASEPGGPRTRHVRLFDGPRRPGRSHNVPHVASSFVGRERDVAEVATVLASARLVTLTGPGGMGKTRLAIQVALGLTAELPDGVWLVELAPLSEGGLVVQEAANVLGVQERPGEPLVDTLVHLLVGKEMLLVLDNCEHLVEEAARLVDTLLGSCPSAHPEQVSCETL